MTTTTLTDSAIEVAGRKLNPAVSPEWQYLLTHFELSEGFSFVVLLVPDADWAEACRIALARYLEAEGKSLLTVAYKDAEDFAVTLPGRLLELHLSEQTGAVWVSATVSEASQQYQEWIEGWRGMSARLNQFRNPLSRQINVPLVFVGSHWIQPVIREIAPDLWSARTMVTRVEPPAERTVAAGLEATRGQQLEGLAIDPDFALQTAQRLRGKEGTKLALAQLLYRAGLGLNARYRWQEARAALDEGIDLQRKFNAPIGSLADSLRALGYNLQRRYEFEEAVSIVNKALSLCRLAGDVLGEANCIQRLGDIARETSESSTAQARYEEALNLYRDIGNVVGEANSITKLADIALDIGGVETAQRRYQLALTLYRQFGEAPGEASCVKGLAEVALCRSDLVTAQALFNEALALYDHEGELNGKAQCIKRLGDIYYERLDLYPADHRYKQASDLFHQLGDVFGEAECLIGQGDIARDRQDEATALFHYQRTAMLYRRAVNQVDGVRYFKKLSELAHESKELAGVRQFFLDELNRRSHIPGPAAAGLAHFYLALTADNLKEQREQIHAAREAWAKVEGQDLTEILDQDLIEILEKQFSITGGQ